MATGVMFLAQLDGKDLSSLPEAGAGVVGEIELKLASRVASH